MITSQIFKHFASEKFWIIGLLDFEIALIVFSLRNPFSAFSCYSFWYGRISIWIFFRILLDVTCSYFLDPCAYYADEEFCPFEISKFLIFLAFCVFYERARDDASAGALVLDQIVHLLSWHMVNWKIAQSRNEKICLVGSMKSVQRFSFELFAKLFW